jgi:hypothetical protein
VPVGGSLLGRAADVDSAENRSIFVVKDSNIWLRVAKNVEVVIVSVVEIAKQVLPGVAFNSDRNTFELLVRLITKMRAGQMDKSSDMCQMVSLSARFGMTPSDRAKISVEAPKESALTKFLAGHTPSAPKVQ